MPSPPHSHPTPRQTHPRKRQTGYENQVKERYGQANPYPMPHPGASGPLRPGEQPSAYPGVNPGYGQPVRPGARPGQMGAHSRPEQTGQASGFSELRPGAQKRRSLKQKRGLRWPQLVFLLFILAFVVSIGLFSWDRWFRYDDAKDFRGEWTQVSAAAPSGGSGLMPPEGTSDGDAGLADGASQDGGTAAEGSGATDGSGATEGSGATAEGQGMEDGQGLEGGIMPESQGAPDGGIASDGAGLTTSNTAQGQASASTPVSINDKKIQLTPEVSYEYTLDTWSKTVVYTFGTMRGSGKYRFSQDRKKLVIIEGGTDDWILAARIALGLAEPEEGTDPAKTTILVKP